MCSKGTMPLPITIETNHSLERGNRGESRGRPIINGRHSTEYKKLPLEPPYHHFRRLVWLTQSLTVLKNTQGHACQYIKILNTCQANKIENNNKFLYYLNFYKDILQ